MAPCAHCEGSRGIVQVRNAVRMGTGAARERLRQGRAPDAFLRNRGFSVVSEIRSRMTQGRALPGWGFSSGAAAHESAPRGERIG
jgi:hypothetical protein